jgi:hypothetical protein
MNKIYAMLGFKPKPIVQKTEPPKPKAAKRKPKAKRGAK